MAVVVHDADHMRSVRVLCLCRNKLDGELRQGGRQYHAGRLHGRQSLLHSSAAAKWRAAAAWTTGFQSPVHHLQSFCTPACQHLHCFHDLQRAAVATMMVGERSYDLRYTLTFFRCLPLMCRTI